jgi:deoxyguanosine kinase
MRYPFIAIEGNIGSGKTTLSEMLAEEFQCKLVLEQFSDNPFLPKFYEQPERHAFPLELFFMAERYQQLGALREGDLFSNQMIADYFLMKSKLFAQNNLKEDELLLFNRLSDIALQNLPKPDLLVYLHSDVSRLQQNIQKRGRGYEQNISDNYLTQIQNRYFDYFRQQQDYPVLILDVTQVNFVEDTIVYQKIVGLLDKSYDIGIHRISL